MAVLVCCGFERGTHSGLATGNANNKYLDRTQGTLGTNVELVAAAARTGSYGLRLTASAATVFCGFANNANGGVLGTNAIIVQSFWFRIPSLPAANAIVWSSFGTVGGADMALRFVQSTGTLNAEVGASTVTGPTVSANTWYHVDLKADYSVNPHTLDWRFNEVAQTQVTAALAAEQIFNAGWGLDNAAQTITFHIDDTLMSVTAADYPFGKHKVVQLTPDAGGTAAEIGTANATRRFTTNSTADGSFNSADILTAISEIPPLIGSTATGVCQVTSGTGNAVGIPMTSYTLAGGETVGGLRIVVVGWAATTTAAAIGLRTFNGTTETTLFSSADPNFDASTTAPAGLCKMATLANFDTQSELDALVVRLGYSADVSPIIGAHAIYAELAVKEASGTNAPSENASGTGSVDASTRTVTTGSQASTGSGTVDNPSPSIGGSSSPATATAIANDATIQTTGGTNAAAATATATGTAGNTSSTVTTTAADAAATGVAHPASGSIGVTANSATAISAASDPVIQTGSFTNAPATTASASGTASAPSGRVATGIPAATATGTVDNPAAVATVTVDAGEAAGIGAANNATVTKNALAQAECAIAVGAVSTSTLSILVAAEAAVALATAYTPAAGGILPGTGHAATGSAPTATAAVSSAPTGTPATGTVPTSSAAVGATPSASVAVMTVPTATGA